MALVVFPSSCPSLRQALNVQLEVGNLGTTAVRDAQLVAYVFEPFQPKSINLSTDSEKSMNK